MAETVFWLVNSFSCKKLFPEELKQQSPKPQVHKGITEFHEQKVLVVRKLDRLNGNNSLKISSLRAQRFLYRSY